MNLPGKISSTFLPQYHADEFVLTYQLKYPYTPTSKKGCLLSFSDVKYLWNSSSYASKEVK
jgi:hypothetical protein